MADGDVNRCAHPTCERAIKADELACEPHWQALPREIRQLVATAYTQRLATRRPGPYIRAAARAVQYWRRLTPAMEPTDMKANAHQCARPGCDMQIPRYVYACRSCWYSLPAKIRNAINDGWRHRTKTGDVMPHRTATAEAQRFWARQDFAAT